MVAKNETYRVAVNEEPSDGMHHSAFSFGRHRWFIIYEGTDGNAVKKLVGTLSKEHISHLTMVVGNPKSIKPVFFKKDDETKDWTETNGEPEEKEDTA
jgi:hypothetical protein